ncbi:MAG: hypothetical protein JNK86_07075 [Alphaproteobacteria bacterium]|nr:hypothetical protein [Alphaproteobacteria bacterium]
MVLPKIQTYRDLDRLSGFLDKAIKKTFVVDAGRVAPCRWRSYDYEFVDGVWRLHDTSVGFREFGGQQVVYHEGDPVWEMGYHGMIRNTSFPEEKIMGFLKRALFNRDQILNMPRGPALYIEPGKKWKYTNKSDGQLDEFIGREQILIADDIAYIMNYHGGLLLE